MSEPQQIINVGEVANDGTGESLRDAFNAINNNFANVWAAGPVDTDVVIRNNEVTTNVTNLDLKLAGNGIGNVVFASTLMPTIDGVHDLGSGSKRWSEIHGQYFYGNGAFLTGIDPGNSFTVINANGTPISADATSDTLILTAGNNLVMLGNAATDTIAFAVKDSPTFVNVDAVQVSAQEVSAQQVFGNVVITPVANIGNISISNTTITTVQGNANLVLSANGTGIVTSTANIAAPNFFGNVIGNISGNITVPGDNGEVIFNDSGQAGASPGFVFEKAANALIVAGNITGTNLNGTGYGITDVVADRGGDTTNWNTMLQMGTYAVNRVNWGGVTGAPLDSSVYVGLLEVKTANSQGSMLSVEQSYYPGIIDDMNNVKIQYNRSFWNGSWTQWVKMTNDGQQIDGGSF